MKLHRMPVTTMAGGSELCLYIHEIQGKLGDGPTVGLSAAIHGDEYTGTTILIQIAKLLADGNFRGRLLLLPVANPHTFESLTRETPVDRLNLNHVFPGNANGWFTEQLAATITKTFLKKIDILLDFHAGGAAPTVDYTYIFNDEKLSRSFGSKILHVPPPEVQDLLKHTSVGVAQSLNIPSVVVELGGGRIEQQSYVERGIWGTMNFLKTCGVLDGEPEPLPEQVVVGEIATIRPHHGGLIYTEAPPLGEKIGENDVLGRIISPYTFEELEVIKNPFKRGIMILSHVTVNVVPPGTYGYMVGNLDSLMV